jgi:hypothetical protein
VCSRSSSEKGFKEGPALKVTSTPLASETSGDLGYVQGEYSLQMGTASTRGKYVLICKRLNGQWKISGATDATTIAGRRARDEFDDEVVGPEVVERADVRVVERSNRARFALEPLAEFGRANLDRDVAAETGVASPVDLAHPARSDAPVDLVWSEPFAGAEGHAVAIVGQWRLRA